MLIVMTLHPRGALTVEVGVRELHDQLSKYVRHVSDGGEVIVTMRGRPVARMAPVERDDPFVELRARGLIQTPTQPKRHAGSIDRVKARGSVSDLVAEQRR